MSARRKDRQRLARFIREVSGRAHTFARRLTGNSEDAQELVQDAAFRLIRHWEDYHGAGNLEPLFMAIIRNAYFDGIRSCERRLSIPLSAPLSEGSETTLADIIPGNDETPEEMIARQESSSTVRQALDRLSPDHLRILVACDMEGVEQQRAATALGIAPGTVRSRLSRARQALRAQVSQLMV